MSEKTLLVSPGKGDMGVQDSRTLGTPGDVEREADSPECFGGREGRCGKPALWCHMIT